MQKKGKGLYIHYFIRNVSCGEHTIQFNILKWSNGHAWVSFYSGNVRVAYKVEKHYFYALLLNWYIYGLFTRLQLLLVFYGYVKVNQHKLLHELRRILSLTLSPSPLYRLLYLRTMQFSHFMVSVHVLIAHSHMFRKSWKCLLFREWKVAQQEAGCHLCENRSNIHHQPPPPVRLKNTEIDFRPY